MEWRTSHEISPPAATAARCNQIPSTKTDGWSDQTQGLEIHFFSLLFPVPGVSAPVGAMNAAHLKRFRSSRIPERWQLANKLSEEELFALMVGASSFSA